MKVFDASHVPDPIGRPRPHTGTHRGAAPTDTVVGGTNGGAKEAPYIGTVKTVVAVAEQTIQSAATKRVFFTESSQRDRKPFRLLGHMISPRMEPIRVRHARSHPARRR